ncbi:hypothetical protein MMC25_005957 [Agyrium rufum]|nr:hypothetical protein [Agyrium rufum]
MNPQGAGDARPTALQIIHDEGLEGKLVGKVIVITGASSGIGLETARALSITGATLVLTVRDAKKAKTSLAEILEGDRVSMVTMDNASFASVRTAAAQILARSGNQVNILINNAGIIGAEDRRLTEDGHEMTFQSNHLGHFLLFQLLKATLLVSSRPTFRSRVVMVSSSGHRSRTLVEHNRYDPQNGDYNFMSVYCNSKLANVYMANELDRRYGDKGLHAVSLHPGGIKTDIARLLDPGFVAAIMDNEKVIPILKTPEQGAATTIVAAVNKEWGDKGGRYLENCEEASRGEDDNNMMSVGWVRHTYDAEEERRLWKDSLEMVGMADDR